ncbi:MAG: energy transducer TonB, partial [Verrucomicrobiota bacterium]|nr:energy transducer TonB [Verrucomicrobiota bacterium]
MTAALLYRPAPKSGIWIALCLAVLLHLGVIGLAALRPIESAADVATDFPFVDFIPETEPPLATEITPEEMAPPPPPPDPFMIEENPSLPVRLAPSRPAAPLVRPDSARRGSGNPTSARVLALRAPRPEYPYEARRQRLTGSGVALLTIDPGSGAVVEVAMAQSTGSSVLDHAAVSGLRRWRFRPGTAPKIRVP